MNSHFTYICSWIFNHFPECMVNLKCNGLTFSFSIMLICRFTVHTPLQIIPSLGRNKDNLQVQEGMHFQLLLKFIFSVKSCEKKKISCKKLFSIGLNGFWFSLGDMEWSCSIMCNYLWGIVVLYDNSILCVCVCVTSFRTGGGSVYDSDCCLICSVLSWLVMGNSWQMHIVLNIIPRYFCSFALLYWQSSY